MTEDMTTFEKVKADMVADAMVIYQYLNGLDVEETQAKFHTLYDEAKNKGITKEIIIFDYVLSAILKEMRNQFEPKPYPQEIGVV
jgi:hypothetical protein